MKRRTAFKARTEIEIYYSDFMRITRTMGGDARGESQSEISKKEKSKYISYMEILAETVKPFLGEGKRTILVQGPCKFPEWKEGDAVSHLRDLIKKIRSHLAQICDLWQECVKTGRKEEEAECEKMFDFFITLTAKCSEILRGAKHEA